jgi:glycosyltransferase involved in cell wall biosynthesis
MRDLEVSVVIPTYNRATLLPRAVASALANVRTGDEVIVVDDGSTDDTAMQMAQFADRVRYARLSHGGAGATRNAGVRLATKPLIAFLDSDDAWMPDKLALQRSLMERRPDVLFCFSDFVSRELTGDRPHFLQNWHFDPRPWDEILGPGMPYSGIAALPPGRDDFRVHFGDLYLAEMERDFVPTFTLVARREQGRNALHFAEDVVTFEDWECFARLAGAGTAAYLDCDTAWQYEHAGPRLTNAKVFDRASSRLKILERVWGADESFLAAHRERYTAICQRYRLQRAIALLYQARTREARRDLHAAGASPIRYRMLATLPGMVVRILLDLRQAFNDL